MCPLFRRQINHRATHSISETCLYLYLCPNPTIWAEPTQAVHLLSQQTSGTGVSWLPGRQLKKSHSAHTKMGNTSVVKALRTLLDDCRKLLACTDWLNLISPHLCGLLVVLATLCLNNSSYGWHLTTCSEAQLPLQLVQKCCNRGHQLRRTVLKKPLAPNPATTFPKPVTDC